MVVTHVKDWRTICQHQLWKVLHKFSGCRIRIRRLEENFKKLKKHSTKVEMQQFTRPFILWLSGGGLLIPNKSWTNIHLRWLLQLINLKEDEWLSWGSVVLTTLYQEMSHVTEAPKIKLSDVYSYCSHEHGINYQFYEQK